MASTWKKDVQNTTWVSFPLGMVISVISIRIYNGIYIYIHIYNYILYIYYNYMDIYIYTYVCDLGLSDGIYLKFAILRGTDIVCLDFELRFFRSEGLFYPYDPAGLFTADFGFEAEVNCEKRRSSGAAEQYS